jgi:hypothetical protein
MKWFTIKTKTVLAVFAMVLQCATLFAQVEIAKETKDTVVIITDSIKPDGTKNYRAGWGILIPEFAKVQYAGNMGFISLGGGWDYGVNKHWETDIFVGFLPHYSTSKNKITLTLKQNYIPWHIDVSRRFMVEPLTTGMYINSIWGRDFWVSEPDKYPNGYYAFSSKIRFNAFLGQRITYKFSPQREIIKSISLFYEVSSNDLYIISAFNNSYLKPEDYLTLSFGFKVQLF